MIQSKRQYRNDMSDEQKQKISQKLKGRTLSNDTKAKISKSMEKYWASIKICIRNGHIIANEAHQ